MLSLSLWCYSCFRMLKLYSGFTELASLAKLYLITLVVRCLSCFPILSLSLDAILGFECWDVSWLHGARFARKIIFNYTCPWLFVLFWNAQLVFGCYSWFLRLGRILASRSSLKNLEILIFWIWPGILKSWNLEFLNLTWNLEILNSWIFESGFKNLEILNFWIWIQNIEILNFWIVVQKSWNLEFLNLNSKIWNLDFFEFRLKSWNSWIFLNSWTSIQNLEILNSWFKISRFLNQDSRISRFSRFRSEFKNSRFQEFWIQVQEFKNFKIPAGILNPENSRFQDFWIQIQEFKKIQKFKMPKTLNSLLQRLFGLFFWSLVEFHLFFS